MSYVKKTSKVIAGVFVVFFSFVIETTNNIVSHLFNKVGYSVSYVYAAIKEEYKEFFYTLEESLKVILPQAQEIKEEVITLTEEKRKAIESAAGIELNPEYNKEMHWYKGISNGKVIGYACIDIVPGKWGPVKYMIGIEPDGKITNIVVMALSERRGRPVKERKFLDQYIGKTISDPIKLKKDIKGIAGATITSRGMTEGIKKVVYAFKEFYQEKQSTQKP